MNSAQPFLYRLIDFGGGRKLERWASVLLDRDCPAAHGFDRRLAQWSNYQDSTATTSLVYVRLDDEGRVLAGELPDRWEVQIDSLWFGLRLTPFGHVGVFPEQTENWAFLRQLSDAAIVHAATSPTSPTVALNLFAYTGGSTLALSQAGMPVVHVDASEPSMKWARQNAERNGLAVKPIRWIVEDARKFVQREIRRDRRYGIVVLDPPSFGHGPSGQRWEIRRDLPELISGCLKLLMPGGQVLLTAHSADPDLDEVADWLRNSGRAGRIVQQRRMHLVDLHGRKLDCGFCVRFQVA